jgi:23S rRNA (adenine-N6)-dimethyltransferase
VRSLGPSDPSFRSFGYHRIRNRQIAERIVACTGLAPPDLVFEFGAGDGQLTEAIASRCRRVVCIEADRTLWRRLRMRFAQQTNVEPVLADFMAYALPERASYKLISNVPFGHTADVMRRLCGLAHPPTETFLVLQLEAARKWGGVGHETVASVLLKTRFEVQPVLALHRSAFAPRPNVDAMLLRLVKRQRPMVSPRETRQFENFVRRGFTDSRTLRRQGDGNGRRPRHPGDLPAAEWVRLFRGR